MQPEDVWECYQRLSKISPMFTVAAAFGNVHGVYKVRWDKRMTAEGAVPSFIVPAITVLGWPVLASLPRPVQPGNVKLSPEILDNSQKFIKEKLGTEDSLPVYFVFHGGSGSEKDKIESALTYGVIKMNIDTDTQWAYWDGVRTFEASKHDYLQVA